MAGDIQIETLFPEQFNGLTDRRFMPENGMLTLEERLAKPHVMQGLLVKTEEKSAVLSDLK
ncbi:hypothetical protein [Dickeya zeae]|uniref:hypothetical protein n=1 Tax=Dickeya zeae TaxID=204042 RepID=UPI000C9B4702|nr:hypothetical protein [Dickeya zeae]AUQ23580.1 hypothetical protein C1O30_00100 [Dickeya zeae]UJR56719.1 hypothetical protein HJ580_00095 [Dickeya zeae]